MSAIIKFVTPADLSIPAHPVAPDISVRQNGGTSRIFVLGANTEHIESESPLWKFTAEATASQLLSVEDGLLILFGFISGCAIASCFTQIVGLFA